MSLIPGGPTELNEPAIWQDVEFGAYTADLPVWRELAAAAGGTVVELGAGSGRVGLTLARDGREVVAVDTDGDLVAALAERAGEASLTAVQGDATALGEVPGAPGAALVIGPLQVIQLLDTEQRAAALAAIAGCLGPGGRCALALVDERTLVDRASIAVEPPPDMREVDGWVFSSEPLWVQVTEDELRMRRYRQRVAPSGDQVSRVHDDLLFRLSPEQLEAEAEGAGLRPAERLTVPGSEHEAGSVVVVLEETG